MEQPIEHVSRACQQRIDAGAPLAGSFALDRILSVTEGLADIGVILRHTTGKRELAIFQDMLAALHETVCELQNQAYRLHEAAKEAL